jgi:hypothetical protein
MSSGFFILSLLFVVFGNAGSSFYGIFSPAFCSRPDEESVAFTVNRVYSPRIAAQSVPPKPDRSEMPIFLIGRSGAGLH